MPESTTENSEDDVFDYDGYLLFNRVFTTELIEEAKDMQNTVYIRRGIENHLTGEIESDGVLKSGYDDIDLTDFITDTAKNALDGQISSLFENVVGKRFFRETKGGEEEVILDDETRDVVTSIEKNNAYLYWTGRGIGNTDGLLIVQGSKDNANTAESDIVGRFGKDVGPTPDLRLNPVKFDQHFFLWLFYKSFESSRTETNIKIKDIKKIRLSGNEDFYGEEMELTNSVNMLRSTPLIEGLLKNKLPVTIEATFDLGDDSVVANISEEGRVHVKSEQYIESLDKSGRIGVAIKFVRDFTSLYNSWKFYKQERKYVPPSFAEKLDKNASDQNVDINFRRELVTELLENRGEEIEDWDLDFSSEDEN
ncbi:MAG: hypothetical protein ABEI13_00425 [Candidatus Paceibacteria bacterium]